MRESLNQPGSFVILSTIDPQGFPSLIPVGSLVSRSPTMVLMGLRQTLRSLANIRKNARVGILHLGSRSKFRIKGLATPHGEIPGSDSYFGVPCLTVAVDVSFIETIATGASVQPFVYWTWGVKHLEALDSIRRHLLSMDLGPLAAGTAPASRPVMPGSSGHGRP
jgi:hypothetical protein